MAGLFARVLQYSQLLCQVRTRSSNLSKKTMPGSTTASPAKNEVVRADIHCSPSKRLRFDNKEDVARPTLRFCRMTENAYPPTRGTKFAAGYDLYRFVAP